VVFGSIRTRALLAAAAALIIGALVSPLAAWGEERSFAAHMGQHLLVGDLAPLALVLAAPPRFPRRAVALALPVWIANFAVWHVPVVFEAALHHGSVHLAQHVALFFAGAFLWTAILGPVLSVEMRLAIVVGMMVSGLALSSVFLWWPRVLYSTYAHARGLAGMSPLTDQRTGGGLMLLEGMLVGLAAAGWLIVELLREEPLERRSARRPAVSPKDGV